MVQLQKDAKRFALAALLVLSLCCVTAMAAADGADTAVGVVGKPSDIFSDVEDPYGYHRYPYIFEEDPGWSPPALRNELGDGPYAERSMAALLREARKGNPLALTLLSVSLYSDGGEEFWLRWAGCFSTEAWATIRYLAVRRPGDGLSRYYGDNVPAEVKRDAWALYALATESSRVDKELLLRSAELGFPPAMGRLARNYYYGDRQGYADSLGLPQDEMRAYYLAAEAARRGDAGAWGILEECYEKGIPGLFASDEIMRQAAERMRYFAVSEGRGVLLVDEMEKEFPPQAFTKKEAVDLALGWAREVERLRLERCAAQARRTAVWLPLLNVSMDAWLLAQANDGNPSLRKHVRFHPTIPTLMSGFLKSSLETFYGFIKRP